MTYATHDETRTAVEEFRRFDADTQLGLLWYGYLDLKDQLNPNPTGAAIEPAQALCHQIAALPPKEQLQAQRDIVNGANSPYTRTYNALPSSGKLEVWLLLAIAMEEGSVIQVPPDYKLPESTKDFSNRIKQLDFEQRLNFMRSVVNKMGDGQLKDAPV